MLGADEMPKGSDIAPLVMRLHGYKPCSLALIGIDQEAELISKAENHWHPLVFSIKSEIRDTAGTGVKPTG